MSQVQVGIFAYWSSRSYQKLYLLIFHVTIIICGFSIHNFQHVIILMMFKLSVGVNYNYRPKDNQNFFVIRHYFYSAWGGIYIYRYRMCNIQYFGAKQFLAMHVWTKFTFTEIDYCSNRLLISGTLIFYPTILSH